MQDHRRAATRAERDAAPHGPLRPRVGRLEREAAQHGAQHDLHLLLGEGGADAAAAATAERDPRIAARGYAEEPLGPEFERLRVQLRVVVDEKRHGHQRDSRRILEPADPHPSLRQSRLHRGQHRAQSQDLLDSRGEVLVAVVRVEFGAESRRDPRFPGEVRERPRELRGGRLVPRDQRRQQLIAQLLVAHLGAVRLVAGAQQRRQDVRAGRGARVQRGPALAHLREDQLVGTRRGAPEAAQHREPTREGVRRGHDRHGMLCEREHFRDCRAQVVQARAAVAGTWSWRLEPEHGPQHDLERQALESRMQPHRFVGWPAGELGLGQLDHQSGQLLHPLAVESGQQQPALLHVGVLVEQDHRVAPEDRLEDPRALAGVQHLRIGCEHLADLVRIGQHHERRLERQPDGRAAPVASQPQDRRGRSRPHPDELEQRRQRRSGWQLRYHRTAEYMYSIVCKQLLVANGAARDI